MTELEKLSDLNGLKLLVLIIPETRFACDAELRNLQGTEHDGWSIWIRETAYGFPFEYNSYMETAVHEAAHALTRGAIGRHTHRDKLFKANLSQLRKRAGELGIWPKEEVPVGIRTLFASASKRTMMGKKNLDILRAVVGLRSQRRMVRQD